MCPKFSSKKRVFRQIEVQIFEVLLYVSSAESCVIIARFWRERLFIFRELGSTGNYLMVAGEQAHNFGDLGSPAQK